MGRPRSPHRRDNMVCVRLNDLELEVLDQLRGGLSRGLWFRQQVQMRRNLPPRQTQDDTTEHGGQMFTISPIERTDAEDDWKNR